MDINKIYEIFKLCGRVETDTRKNVENALFVALKGENSDGNRYVKIALEKGAAYALADDKTLEHNPKIIIVDDTLKTLQALATFHRDAIGIPILAITGSNGKTTTKELVSLVLSKKYSVAATHGNYNNHIGVAFTLLSIKPENNFAVVEMGANHFDEISTLCQIVKPNYGLINSIGKAHLEFFGNLSGVARAKGELFGYLAANNGLFFMNTDIEHIDEIPPLYEHTDKNIEKYNIKKFNIEIIKKNTPYLCFLFNGIEVQTNLIGNYNIGNALSAIEIGKYFGVSDKDIADAISLYKPNNNRSEFKKTERNSLYIDAYNANPTSMLASLQNFINTEAQEKMLILGDMREVGRDSDAEHERIVNLIKTAKIADVLLVGKNFAKAAQNTNFKCFANVAECNKYLSENIISGKTILIKGSHSIQLEKTVEFL